MIQTINIPGQLFQFNNLSILDEYKTPKYLLDLVGKNSDRIHFLVISGPSGVGKSKVLSLLNRKLFAGAHWALTSRVSTRPQRHLEYTSELSFISEDEFEKLRQNNQLLYSEQYGGNLAKYGILYNELEQIANESISKTIIIITGTLALSKVLPNCDYIYMLPPSLADLKSRLEKSQKPNSNQLFSYDILEMKGLISRVKDQAFADTGISIVINENEREGECANKIALSVINRQNLLEIPPHLLSDLNTELSNRNSRHSKDYS